MKKFLLLLLALNLYAMEYVAQIVPYESYEISASVAGEVSKVWQLKEFSYLKEVQTLIKLDTKTEEIELSNQKRALSVAKKLEAIKRKQFESKKKITRLSEYEKLSEEFNYLTQKQNIVDLEKSIALLQDTLKRKKIGVKERYVGKIYVRKGDYVNVGEKLFDSYDISKLSLELYVRLEDITDIDKKVVFIDGKPSAFKLEKLSRLKDSQNISTYYVKLIAPNSDRDYRFSKVVRVAFRLP